MFFARVFGYDYENATEDDWKKWESDFTCFRLGETYCSAEKKNGNSVLLHMLVCGSIPYGVFGKIAETFPEIHADGRFIQQAEEFFGNVVIEKGGFLWTKFDNPGRRSGKKDFVFDSFFREPDEEPGMDQMQKEVLELLKFDRDNMRALLTNGKQEPNKLDYHSKFYFSEQELKAIAGDSDIQYQLALELRTNEFFDNNPKIYNKKDETERECCEQYFEEMTRSWLKKAALNGNQDAQIGLVLSCISYEDYKGAKEALLMTLNDGDYYDLEMYSDSEDDATSLFRLICLVDLSDLMKCYLDLSKASVDEIRLEEEEYDDDLSLLEYASLHGAVDVVKLLVEDYNASFSTEEKGKKSLLCLAIQSWNLDLVKYLIDDCGFDVDRDYLEEPPLHLVVSRHCESETEDESYTKLLRYIFNQCNNINENVFNQYLETVFDTAWYHGNEVAMELIVERPEFDINDQLRYSVYCFCGDRDDVHDFDQIKWLMDHGADANDWEEDTDEYDREEKGSEGYLKTAFTEAWEKHNEQLMNYFIEQTSFDLNDQLVTALLNHINHGEDYDLIKFLVDHGADVNYIDNSVWSTSILNVAFFNGDTIVADYLISAGADINQVDRYGESVIDGCLCDDNGMDDEEVLGYVRKLVGLGLNMDLLSSALNVAVTNGRTNVVHYLIEECNLNPKDPDKDGDITVNIAAIGNQIELVKWLIKSYNIDINVKGKDGRTPLHESVASSDSEKAEKEQRLVLVKWLVGNGADINCIDDGKKTPLHIAAEFGNDIAVKYFIEECHMDPAINYGAGTPADLAKGNSALVRYLHKKEKE